MTFTFQNRADGNCVIGTRITWNLKDKGHNFTVQVKDNSPCKFVIYYNLMGVAEVWLKNGVVPPAIGMWWVALLPLLLTVMLLRSDRLLSLFRRGR